MAGCTAQWHAAHAERSGSHNRQQYRLDLFRYRYQHWKMSLIPLKMLSLVSVSTDTDTNETDLAQCLHVAIFYIEKLKEMCKELFFCFGSVLGISLTQVGCQNWYQEGKKGIRTSLVQMQSHLSDTVCVFSLTDSMGRRRSKLTLFMKYFCTKWARAVRKWAKRLYRPLTMVILNAHVQYQIDWGTHRRKKWIQMLQKFSSFF